MYFCITTIVYTYYILLLNDTYMNNSDSIVIIPTYNEKENIENIIRAVFALDKCFHILVIDFSHDPNDLPRLYAACHDEGYDVAIGSRYVSGVNVVNWPIGRVLMSYFASKYVRFVTGFNVHDTTAGFKCYRRCVLESIPLDQVRFKGYAFQIEMKYTAYKMGYKIKEVPVIFVNRREGVSKMNGGIFGEAFFGVMRLRWDGWFRKYPVAKH